MSHPLRTLHDAWPGRPCASRLRRERSGITNMDRMLDLARSFDRRGVPIAPLLGGGEVAAPAGAAERRRRTGGAQDQDVWPDSAGASRPRAGSPRLDR